MLEEYGYTNGTEIVGQMDMEEMELVEDEEMVDEE